MKRKPLEGVNALVFVLGALLVYFLREYAWWIVVIAVVLSALVVDQLIEFLREKNNLQKEVDID